jgi:hypothetical protein
MRESIAFALSLIALFCVAEFYSVIKENRLKRQKANNKVIRYPLYGRDGKYVRGGR